MRQNTTERFHQFIKLYRGPVNTAIVDILSGNVFQAPNQTIEAFDAHNYEGIADFLDVARRESLLITIDPARWIPEINLDMDEDLEKEWGQNIELHIEEGLPIREIMEGFQHHPLSKVYYYGPELPRDFASHPLFELKEKNFQRCCKRACVDGNFCRIQESVLRFNMRFNSCWGSIMAITADGNIRPCIHSQQIIGPINEELKDIDGLIEKMNPYWTLTKDKVERCRDCEFRYICFDCREIAIRENGKMDGANPLCRYNPHTGEWKD
jgi:radical SAM protein with 4Fe4S-binding SPASM domain